MASYIQMQLLKNIYYSLGLIKVVNFTAQSSLMPLIDQLATGQKKIN